MIISICNQIDEMNSEKRTVIKEVKTIKEGFEWVKNYAQKEHKRKKFATYYMRIIFLDSNLWSIDYGDYNSFVYFENLPEDAKKQLDNYYDSIREEDL